MQSKKRGRQEYESHSYVASTEKTPAPADFSRRHIETAPASDKDVSAGKPHALENLLKNIRLPSAFKGVFHLGNGFYLADLEVHKPQRVIPVPEPECRVLVPQPEIREIPIVAGKVSALQGLAVKPSEPDSTGAEEEWSF